MRGLLYDCIVVGGGPGGLMAALYLKRFRRQVLVADGGKPRAAWIPKTKNLIGYQGGISGPTLLRRLRAQLAELQVPICAGMAKVDPAPGGFRVEIAGERVQAKTVLLATGIEDCQPAVNGISELRKLGLLRYCPICDGFEFREKKLLLFVNSPDCFAKIYFILQFSRQITVIAPPGFQLARKDQHASRRLRLKTVRGELASLREENGITAELTDGRSFRADAAYVELGFKVRDQAFSHLKLDRCPDGRINVDSLQRTSIPGLFAVGDCVANLAQISVAAGQAAIAATEIHNELLDGARLSKSGSCRTRTDRPGSARSHSPTKERHDLPLRSARRSGTDLGWRD